MKKIAASLTLALAVSVSTFAADEFASAKDAETLVAKVVKAIAANKEGTFKEVTAKDHKWVDRDLYPMVYDMSGKCLAHGQNERQVGKDLIEVVDADGKEYIKERIELAKSKGKFWQDYRFKDPVSKKVLPKTAYCEKAIDVIVCSGIYKR
ncbi:MAG: cache domain-containing protein [Rhodoferax sp.]|nr:cache domain-containing protein [Rhodoferax sp.]